VLRLLRELPVEEVAWVVLSGTAERAREARQAARRVIGRRARLQFLQADFRESYFPYTAVPIKELFDRLGRELQPDLVFTHWRQDLHQDHRLAAELTFNTFRDHLILEYEIIKRDGDIGNPNVYVALDKATVARKMAILRESFFSQRDKPWFSEDVFRSILRLRGVEAGATAEYAEAFHGRKIVI
jgi:LmbE family N-acetylglucosaminyl deacetylase